MCAQVRAKLVGSKPPTYSEYTCYTGIADFTPPDIDTVGYRVFLGNGRYFVSSDVGGGKMQWYGFHKEPQGTPTAFSSGCSLSPMPSPAPQLDQRFECLRLVSARILLSKISCKLYDC